MSKTYLPKTDLRWHWIQFSGKDARDFLHRLTTVNLMQMGPGEGARGCFLNPQGKFRAFFTLWQTGPSAYAFEFDGGKNDHWKELLLSTIDQYTFGEDLKIEEITSQTCQFIFPDEGESLSSLGLPELNASQTVQTDGGLRVTHHGSVDFGRPWITVWGDFHASALVQALGHPQLEDWRVRSLRPGVDSEINETVNPLEIGARDAVAPNKGCYPGQEIIEKIAALGSPARRLVLLESSAPFPAVGSLLFKGDQEAGILTSVSSVSTFAKSANLFSALGLLKKTSAKEGEMLSLGASEASTVQVVRVSSYV